MKTCSKCGLSKEESDYRKRNRASGGLRGVCKSCECVEQEQRRSKYPEKYLLTIAKSRAKMKGLVFDITLDDIEIPLVCPVLKIPLFRGVVGNANSPSLDRIDNSKGYIKGNVAVISQKANTIKGFADTVQLEAVLNYMKGLDKNDETVV